MILIPCIDVRLRVKVEKLDEDARHIFEERAAILEYLGGIHRAVAESEAWRELYG